MIPPPLSICAFAAASGIDVPASFGPAPPLPPTPWQPAQLCWYAASPAVEFPAEAETVPVADAALGLAGCQFASANAVPAKTRKSSVGTTTSRITRRRLDTRRS